MAVLGFIVLNLQEQNNKVSLKALWLAKIIDLPLVQP